MTLTPGQEPRIYDFAHARLLPYIKLQMPKYIIGRHHKLIAHYLQKLEKGEVTRLAVFMPPRHGKTLEASEFFSAWYMGRNPTHEVMFTTFSQDRADDVGKAVRNRMMEDVHGKVFPGSTLKTDAKASRKFFSEKGGVFYAAGWNGPMTGRGASLLILDDLVKDRADALSKANRRKREEWFTSTAYSRLMPDENVTNGRILLIMTRWAYDDIAAFLLKELAHEGWHVLDCPAIAEENDVLGREPGEALWPEFRPLHVLNNIKSSVTPDDWNALYQQKPLPKEGGMLKTGWFRRYDMHELRLLEDLLKANKALPEKLQWFKKIVFSFDTAYKENQINDPSAVTVWGFNKNWHYLLEARTQRLDFTKLKQWVIDLYKKYSAWGLGPMPILIEDAASGQSLIQVLRTETNYPVIAMKPDKSKIIRAEAISDYVQAGRVFIPERAAWLTDFETELAQFPYGRHDDMVDSFTQYLKWVHGPVRRPTKKKIFFK